MLFGVMQEQKMIALRICLLGPPQILRAEESVTHCLSQKALGLLAYLVMGPSHGYTRGKLAGLFWGETDEEHANFNLRRALWSLRKAINPPGTPSDTYICYEGGRYSFNRSSDHWLDVNAFEYAANAYSRHRITTTLRPPSVSQLFTSPGLKNLRGAMQLYRGGFLEGCSPRGCPDFIDWLFLERDRLEQQYIKGLRALAVESAIRSDYQQAITDYQQILSADPLNEATHRDLMVVYYTLGKRDKAVEQYRSFCRVLRQQLDLEPLPEPQTLYLDIRDGTLTVESPSYWLTLAQKITTQVAPSGPFVGREPEQIKLSEAMESAMQGSGCLAVINGEAGVGKPRLIEEFLRRISCFPLIILRARCYAQEQGLPYQPIIDALRDYLSIADFTHIKCLSNLWLAEVAKLLPEIHNHLPHLPISPILFPDQERNRLFEGLAQFITHLSQREPLILFLDDFHAADEPTFDLIHGGMNLLGFAGGYEFTVTYSLFQRLIPLAFSGQFFHLFQIVWCIDVEKGKVLGIKDVYFAFLNVAHPHLGEEVNDLELSPSQKAVNGLQAVFGINGVQRLWKPPYSWNDHIVLTG